MGIKLSLEDMLTLAREQNQEPVRWRLSPIVYDLLVNPDHFSSSLLKFVTKPSPGNALLGFPFEVDTRLDCAAELVLKETGWSVRWTYNTEGARRIVVMRTFLGDVLSQTPTLDSLISTAKHMIRIMQDLKMPDKPDEPMPVGTLGFLKVGKTERIAVRVNGYQVNDEGVLYQVESMSGRYGTVGLAATISDGWYSREALLVYGVDTTIDPEKTRAFREDLGAAPNEE